MEEATSTINAILKNIIKNFNTLLDCPARFSGEYNEGKVHSFIEYIEYYKRLKCITDEQALQELQYLLLDQAHNWWIRRKFNINTWSEALTILENKFSKKRPASIVYTEILKLNYDDYDCKADFVDDKIELFCELTEPELKENTKLEIIYALLPSNMQNKINLLHIKSIKDVKEQLHLAKLDIDKASTNYSNSAGTSQRNIVPSEVEERFKSSNEVSCQKKNNQITVANKNVSAVRDPIIKVRKTEDLMRQDIKEEESLVPADEFLSNDKPSAGNNILNSTEDNFQIDTDIMKQISNIIEESEINIRTLSNNENVSTNLPQASNSVASLELLGTLTQSKPPNKSIDNKSTSQINTTTKLRKRCSYCRCYYHTSKVCLKRTKHMKLYPEKILRSKEVIKTKSLQGTANEKSAKATPYNLSSCNMSVSNIQTSEHLSIMQVSSNQLPITSTSLAGTSVPITNSTVILNNIPEKCTNTILTTKLIAPINGKTSNKMLAAKSRSINTYTPKCHQCGNLGYYKSICPNCSPIYNNTNHIQYNSK